MKSFKHYSARSLKGAATLLAKYNGKARVNAGGTDLLGSLRDQCGSDYPEAVIDIKNIAGLDYIRHGNKGLRIGALTKLADIVRWPLIKQEYPLLAQAAHSIASPNLRNMATVGGNLAQEVRCWYYRYPQQIGGPIACLRKGGRICNALLGDNRYHSLFGAAPSTERRCAGHCPAHINIPAYLRQVRNGNLPEAARILMNYNPIPAITGRVCPVFCEPQCNRGEYDDPVAIQFVERGLGDYILDHAGEYFAQPSVESGRKIAIVGSGPAGLAAAFYLRRTGLRVTVFERMPEPGGMLLYSIPRFRLPRDVVRRQIEALKNMGVRFEVGVPIGNGISIARIKSDSDAVFLAGGTWKSLKLGVPGEEGQGVHHALDYLAGAAGMTPGKNVIVIGGGSVAVDAARTAIRLGAEAVHLVCLETRDLASKDRMPALDQEILGAEEEGILIHPSLGIREIVLKDGRVSGLKTKKCISVRGPDEQFHPQYDEMSPSPSLQADSLIIAIGQTADQSLSEPGITIDRSSPETGAQGIFAGGDMAEGPSTVIQAIASARKAVCAIETFLNGELPAELSADEPEYPESAFENLPRAKVWGLPAADRIRSIEVEDMPGLSLSQVETEARRCVSCGCLAVGPSDLAIALVALDASVVTNKRVLSAQAFFAASDTHTTVLEQNELIKEIRIPRPPKLARQSYLKFTVRRPVDFSIVTVASVIAAKNGICSAARITLGAVAPTPLRATEAEEFLKGKPISEEFAASAAELALGEAKPLSMNAYKAEIAKTLVKRSILGVSC